MIGKNASKIIYSLRKVTENMCNVVVKEYSVCWWVHSLRPSNTYLHLWTKPQLIQIMACHLVHTKPLSEPILVYCQLVPQEQTSVKF